MRDLSFLERDLPVMESPGLDTHDPRFADVIDLIERSEQARAADAIERLLVDQIYDVRLIGHYLYQCFEEAGLRTMASMLGGLDHLLGANVGALGPAKGRERYIEKTLCSLFQRISDELEYHRGKQDARYRAWRREVDVGSITEAIRAGEALVGRLVTTTYPHSSELLGRVLRELREVRDVATAEESDDEPEAAEAATAHPPARTRELISLRHGQDSVELRVSSRFVELCQKLRAFEVLVQKRDFEKAALVADDLSSLIEAFDPRLYFPELFASFSAQLNANVAAVAPYWERRDTLEWRTLKQFYQVDLAAFVGEE